MGTNFMAPSNSRKTMTSVLINQPAQKVGSASLVPRIRPILFPRRRLAGRRCEPVARTSLRVHRRVHRPYDTERVPELPVPITPEHYLNGHDALGARVDRSSPPCIDVVHRH